MLCPEPELILPRPAACHDPAGAGRVRHHDEGAPESAGACGAHGGQVAEVEG